MKKKIELEDLLSLKDAAPKIGLAPRTIYNKINNGELPLPFMKIGASIKFDPRDIAEYLEKRKVKQIA